MRRAAPEGGLAGRWMALGRAVLTIMAPTLVALTASGCETNAERSAELERVAHSHPAARQTGVTVNKQNPAVRVVGTVTVQSEGRTAVVVTLRNSSSQALRDAPIEITVKGSGGKVAYQNSTPGLAPSLTTVALLQPGAQTVWIDDQVQTTGPPKEVSARVGQAPSAPGPAPQLIIEGVHSFEEPGSGEGAEGTVTNHSAVTQQELVVYVLARRGGRVVAAGRALLPELAAGQSAPFQAYLIGSPKGAKLEASAPPTTLG
jgi:hypothetical protein